MNENEILKLESGNFRIESAKMFLKNRGDDSFIISGAGIVEILSDGILQVTLLSKDYSRDLINDNFKSRIPGKIIKDEIYFDLELNDINNRYWKHEKILINSKRILDMSGESFKFNIDNIDNKNQYKCEYNFFIFYLSNKYKIPVNRYENFANGGFSLNH